MSSLIRPFRSWGLGVGSQRQHPDRRSSGGIAGRATSGGRFAARAPGGRFGPLGGGGAAGGGEVLHAPGGGQAGGSGGGGGLSTQLPITTLGVGGGGAGTGSGLAGGGGGGGFSPNGFYGIEWWFAAWLAARLFRWAAAVLSKYAINDYRDDRGSRRRSGGGRGGGGGGGGDWLGTGGRSVAEVASVVASMAALVVYLVGPVLIVRSLMHSWRNATAVSA